MGPSLAFFNPSANLRASTSSFDFSASTDARNFASTASVCSRKRRAVSSRSTDDGGLGGGMWESTAPSSRSTLSLARQHGQSTSKVPAGCLAITAFYARALGNKNGAQEMRAPLKSAQINTD